MVEVQLPPPASPEPPKPKPKPKPSPRQRPTAVARAEPAPSPEPRAEPLKKAAPAAPEAAAASAAVVAKPQAVVDFSDTLVLGNATRPVGGRSAASGTSQHVVHSRFARAGGMRGGTGAAPGSARDLSRAPGLAGGATWDCPFPREADYEGIRQAVVLLNVSVAASGQVAAVRVLKDPGSGFGREARRCAFSKRWVGGLDPSGRPVARAVSVSVRFQR